MKRIKDNTKEHPLIANRYQLDELISQKQGNVLYKAKDLLKENTCVAIKLLEKSCKTIRQEFFSNEIRICTQLSQKSHHIVQVLDDGITEMGMLFYVMEFLIGKKIAELIKFRLLTLPKFLTLSSQVCLGLQCIHEASIIHQDIKPSNLFSIKNDQTGQPFAKILDFGVAVPIDSAFNHSRSGFVGTFAYASPEKLTGEKVDTRSDIYSFGVVMYEMLTSHLPVRAEDFHEMSGWAKAHRTNSPPKIGELCLAKPPKSLEDLVMACLSKSPSDRPQTILEVLEVLTPLEQQYHRHKA
ncbi:MAG: serine/threonine protein kinase [Scytolyngbya sp. HA4215-MV1]|nr:serine/threonine protein kinase [Scytolyngbya sp. HA4215-MV1]